MDDPYHVNPKLRLGIYLGLIILGLIFFLFNHHPLMRMMGLGVAVVCTLAMFVEPWIRAWDRKRQRQGLIDPKDLDGG